MLDHVIPRVPVRQWVLSLPIPLRLLLAAQPKLVTPVLQVVHCVITRHLLGQAGLKAEEADSALGQGNAGAVAQGCRMSASPLPSPSPSPSPTSPAAAAVPKHWTPEQALAVA